MAKPKLAIREIGADALVTELVQDRVARSGVVPAASLTNTWHYFHHLAYERVSPSLPVLPLTVMHLVKFGALFKPSFLGANSCNILSSGLPAACSAILDMPVKDAASISRNSACYRVCPPQWWAAGHGFWCTSLCYLAYSSLEKSRLAWPISPLGCPTLIAWSSHVCCRRRNLITWRWAAPGVPMRSTWFHLPVPPRS